MRRGDGESRKNHVILLPGNSRRNIARRVERNLNFFCNMSSVCRHLSEYCSMSLESYGESCDNTDPQYSTAKNMMQLLLSLAKIHTSIFLVPFMYPQLNYNAYKNKLIYYLSISEGTFIHEVVLED